MARKMFLVEVEINLTFCIKAIALLKLDNFDDRVFVCCVKLRQIFFLQILLKSKRFAVI